MIVKILGGKDEVIGRKGGPYARVLWMKFKVINEDNGQLVFSSAFANANIKDLLIKQLMSLGVPSHISFSVKQSKRSQKPRHSRIIKIGFASYANTKEGLESASKLWSNIPLDIPTLIQHIRNCAENSADMEAINVQLKKVNRSSKWGIQSVPRNQGRPEATGSVHVQPERGAVLQW